MFLLMYVEITKTLLHIQNENKTYKLLIIFLFGFCTVIYDLKID